MINNPLVSVVVPVFNTGNLIIDFVKSIISQTYSNWELILVDDGSGQDTLDCINSLMDADGRIVLYRRDRLPKGSLTCRNIGMFHSNGKYIIHFDADDIVGENCLQQRVSYMEENPLLDFAVFKGATFYVDNEKKMHISNHRWGRKRHEDDIVSFLSNDYPFSVWNCIFRASVFKTILWDEKVKIYTDFSYIVPILIGGFKYGYSAASVEDYFYRVNQKNAMTSAFISNEKFESTINLFSRTQDSISQLPNSALYKKAFKKYYIVQLERIINNNDKKMILDYQNFFSAKYGNEKRLSTLLFICLKCPFLGKRKKIVRLLITLFYRPELLKRWILSIIKKLFM